jgi:hypothetical protein
LLLSRVQHEQAPPGLQVQLQQQQQLLQEARARQLQALQALAQTPHSQEQGWQEPGTLQWGCLQMPVLQLPLLLLPEPLHGALPPGCWSCCCWGLPQGWSACCCRGCYCQAALQADCRAQPCGQQTQLCLEQAAAHAAWLLLASAVRCCCWRGHKTQEWLPALQLVAAVRSVAAPPTAAAAEALRTEAAAQTAAPQELQQQQQQTGCQVLSQHTLTAQPAGLLPQTRSLSPYSS